MKNESQSAGFVYVSDKRTSLSKRFQNKTRGRQLLFYLGEVIRDGWSRQTKEIYLLFKISLWKIINSYATPTHEK